MTKDPAFEKFIDELNWFTLMLPKVIEEFKRANASRDWEAKRRAAAWLTEKGVDSSAK
jgi:hypothetical protein